MTDPEPKTAPGDTDLTPVEAFKSRAIIAQRFSVTGLFALALLYTLYFAKGLFLPIALALLFAWVLRPLVRGLQTLHLPEALAAAIVVAGLLFASGTAIYMLAEPAMGWAENAPQNLRDVERKLGKFKRSLASVQRATDKIDDIASGTPALKPAAEHKALSTTLLSGTQTFAISALTTVILLFFLLASGDLFLRKLVKIIPTLSDKKKAVEIARTIEYEIGRYLLTISGINTVLGLATAAIMYLWGLPNPLLWGAMVMLLNFVPYVGATISLAVLTVVALITFDNFGHALAVPASFLVLTTIEGQIVYPIVVGRNFSVNPVLVFISLLFWGWLWGIAGMLMAVPILVIVKICCGHIESLAFVREFLER